MDGVLSKLEQMYTSTNRCFAYQRSRSQGLCDSNTIIIPRWTIDYNGVLHFMGEKYCRQCMGSKALSSTPTLDLWMNFDLTWHKCITTRDNRTLTLFSCVVQCQDYKVKFYFWRGNWLWRELFGSFVITILNLCLMNQLLSSETELLLYTV